MSAYLRHVGATALEPGYCPVQLHQYIKKIRRGIAARKPQVGADQLLAVVFATQQLRQVVGVLQGQAEQGRYRGLPVKTGEGCQIPAQPLQVLVALRGEQAQ